MRSSWTLFREEVGDNSRGPQDSRPRREKPFVEGGSPPRRVGFTVWAVRGREPKSKQPQQAPHHCCVCFPHGSLYLLSNISPGKRKQCAGRSQGTIVSTSEVICLRRLGVGMGVGSPPEQGVGWEVHGQQGTHSASVPDLPQEQGLPKELLLPPLPSLPS